jgi:PKHD-type hydroxylase
MLLHIPKVLDAAQVAECRRRLDETEWVDGRETVGYQGARVKDNRQLPERHPVALRLGDMILGVLERNPLFISAALPLKVLPPLFNRYAGGQHYGSHIDGAIRQVPGSPHRVRSDLPSTLVLRAPEEYDGGELTIEDSYGARAVKLPAGDMVLYPGTSVHHVRPVTRGARIAAFFWVQSMVREDSQRTMLFDLDTAIQEVAGRIPDAPAVVRLTNVYHNLLRRWADV